MRRPGLWVAMGVVPFTGMAAAAQEVAPSEAPAVEAPAVEAPAPSPAVEVRETWDASGRLTRRLELVGGQLAKEIVQTWDEAGRLSARVTTEAGQETREAWTYDEAGRVLTLVVTVDGATAREEAWTYDEAGRVQTRTVKEAGVAKTTTYAYDGEGRAVLVETRGAEGALLERTVSDRQPTPPAPVPITLAVSGGVATDSDVRTTSVTAGFEIERKVPPELYDTDHLEVSAYGSYTLGISKGEKTNDDLSAGFGLDYNEFVDRTTAFLFMRVERNPVSNLDVDLEIAPVGIKYAIVPKGGVFWLDASFAPVWNFRSILVEAGGECEGAVVEVDTHCTFNKIRGSFRVRLGVEVDGFALKDVLEFQPVLNPASGDLVAGVGEEAILKNATTLSLKLSDALALSSAVTFTRDPLLVEQADCEADPENLLCDGMMLETASTLTLSMSF